MSVEVEPTSGLAELRRSRARMLVDQVDYARALRRVALSPSRPSQGELARHLGVSQPAVSKALARAVEQPLPREGFSGAGPYEIAQRYAAGDLTRGQVVDELGRWDYEPVPVTDGYDSLLVVPAGTVEDVVRALREGLVDEPVYLEVLEVIDRRADSGAAGGVGGAGSVTGG